MLKSQKKINTFLIHSGFFVSIFSMNAFVMSAWAHENNDIDIELESITVDGSRNSQIGLSDAASQGFITQNSLKVEWYIDPENY